MRTKAKFPFFQTGFKSVKNVSGASPREVLRLHGRPHRGAQLHHCPGRSLDPLLHRSLLWDQQHQHRLQKHLFNQNMTRASFSGNWVWAIIWSIANLLVYAAVIFGMMKTKKIFLLPALFVSVFDVIVGILNGIINFVLFNWFA